MVSLIKRSDGRAMHQIRKVTVTYGVYPHAAGSVLFALDATKVLVGVTMQPGVPPFLRGKKRGWLTAEYSLLPLATHTRSARESTQAHRNGRSIEISRLIGRVFRSVTQLQEIGERTIHIDCDVLQADGSTRTAAINGITAALKVAQEQWLADKLITKPILQEEPFAVSVGIIESDVLVDIDYAEDQIVRADFTFVITRNHNLVELQGGAEQAPIPWALYDQVREGAKKGIAQLITVMDAHQVPQVTAKGYQASQKKPYGTSLASLLQHTTKDASTV